MGDSLPQNGRAGVRPGVDWQPRYHRHQQHEQAGAGAAANANYKAAREEVECAVDRKKENEPPHEREGADIVGSSDVQQPFRDHSRDQGGRVKVRA